MPITRPDGCDWPNGVDPSECTVQNLRAIVSDNNDRNEDRDVSNCSLPGGALDDRDIIINENTCSFNPCCASMFTNFWDQCRSQIPLSQSISRKYDLLSNACKRLPAPAGNCEDVITTLPETCSVANLSEIMSQYCPSENQRDPPNLCQDQCCREVFTNYVHRCRQQIDRDLAGVGDPQLKRNIDTLFESCLASSPTGERARCENGPNDQPCQNGGEAVGVYPKCICECPTNYHGEHCENRDWIQNRSRVSIQGCELENQPTEVSPETCADFYSRMHTVAGPSPTYCLLLNCNDRDDASRCCRGAFKEYVDNCDGVEWVEDSFDRWFQSQEEHDQAIQIMREHCGI